MYEEEVGVMDRSKIDRINELGRISKERALTKEELLEQKQLREEYIKFFRAGIRGELESNGGMKK